MGTTSKRRRGSEDIGLGQGSEKRGGEVEVTEGTVWICNRWVGGV